MIDKQIISEMWRHRDIGAGVILKNKSIYSTLQSARFEEARVAISLKANQDNMYLKKAEHKVAQLNAIALDNDYILTTPQIDDVKTTINEIPSGVISYTSTVNTIFEEVPTTEIKL